MADEPTNLPPLPDFGAEGNPTLQQLVDYASERFHDPENLRKRETAEANASIRAKAATALGALRAAKDQTAGVVGEFLEPVIRVLVSLTDAPDWVLDPIARGALESLLKDEEPRHGVPDVGNRLLAKLSGTATTIEPGTGGAERYLSLFINESVEAWLRGVLGELVTEFFPTNFSGIGGGIESFQKLQEVIEHALGGDRMVRRVLQPFISATAITPSQWHVNKRFRPELLSSGDAIRHHLRGRWTLEQLREELARQGWSDERIDILITNATKRLSVDQLLFLYFRGTISDADVLTRTRDLGYDDATANALIEIELAQRRDRALAPVVDAAVDAFLRGDVDDATLRRLVEGSAPNYKEAQDVINAAHTRRELRARSLTSAEERRLALLEIRSVIDFRRALEREGRSSDAVDALELELRLDLQEQRDLVAAKAAAAADKAAAAKRAADDKAARDAALLERKALPTLQEYERAYVRGRLARDQFAAAVRREKIAITADDLELLLADADDARAKYLADEEKRAKAAALDAGAAVPLAKIEDAVLRGILAVEDYARELERRGVSADDSRILVALLNDRLEDRADADAQKAAAADRAQLAGVSLAAFERAVRLGLRTRDQYAELLDELQTSAPAKALVLDLLDAQLEADAAAAAKRQALEDAGAAKGIALSQRRRIVVAGLRPIEYYEDALRAAGWPLDDQLAELDLVQAEIDDRAAAEARQVEIEAEEEERRQREEEERQANAGAGAPGAEPPTLTLSQVQRAVRLGILEPDDLRAWLVERGYDDADVETMVRLTIADVPTVRAGQALEETVAADLAKKGIQLADLKNAVRRGLRTLEEYGEDLASRGYDEDAVALLVELLREELAIDFDQLKAKIAKSLDGLDGAPTIEELVAAAAAGAATTDEIRAVLEHFDVPRDTALVFSRLAPFLG